MTFDDSVIKQLLCLEVVINAQSISLRLKDTFNILTQKRKESTYSNG